MEQEKEIESNNLIWQTSFEFVSPLSVEECMHHLKAANGSRYGLTKIAVDVIKPYRESQPIRFQLENWYGGIKVLVVGRIEFEDDASVVIKCQAGVHIIYFIIYFLAPVILIPFLHNSSLSFISNILGLATIYVLFYMIITVAIISIRRSLKNATIRLFLG